MSTNLYAPRDTESLSEHYMRHLSAMTAEGLHDKSAIAAELAYRDARLVACETRETEFAQERDGWRRETARLLNLCRDAECRAEQADAWKALLRRIDAIFGCEHVEHGPEDAEALVRHVRSMKDSLAAAKAEVSRLRAPSAPTLRTGTDGQGEGEAE